MKPEFDSSFSMSPANSSVSSPCTAYPFSSQSSVSRTDSLSEYDFENDDVFSDQPSSAKLDFNNVSPDSKSNGLPKPDIAENPPKRKRYNKSRRRERSPALVQKLKKTRRNKANDRERNRMHGLNDALEDLRCILPNTSGENKLTKIETLRMAHNYIWMLSQTLEMIDKPQQEVFASDAMQTPVRNDITTHSAIKSESSFQCQMEQFTCQTPSPVPSIQDNQFQTHQSDYFPVSSTSRVPVNGTSPLDSFTLPVCSSESPVFDRHHISQGQYVKNILQPSMAFTGYGPSFSWSSVYPRPQPGSPTEFSDTSDGFSYEMYP